MPSPCSPVICECLWKKTQIEKKILRFGPSVPNDSLDETHNFALFSFEEVSAYCFKYQIASSLFMEQWFGFSMRGAMVLRTNFGTSKLELLLRAAVLFLPLYFLILCELWMKANRKNACRLTLEQFCWGASVARLFVSCFQL